MRGRFGTQPFLVEVENGGSHLSPQRNFSPAPLGNPVAPSSVTFGDSFPPRGSLWVVQPYPKKRPKSGYADGHRNSPSTVPLRPTTPKRASGNVRALRPGGAGGHPPRLFASGLSLEKAWIPRPGPGGNPPRRCQPAPVQTRTTYQGQPGAAYPLGGCLRSHLGAQRPGGPACPAGVPISPEKWGERGPGASPLAPRFYGPLAAARSFWRSCRIVSVVGLFRCPSSYPDLETFFHKMLFRIFFRKMRPKSVLAYRRK